MLPAIDGATAAALPANDRPLLVHHVPRICGISSRTVWWTQ